MSDPGLSHDYLGNPATAASEAELAAIDGFVRAFLSYEARAAEVVAAADARPGNALLNAYAGILWMLLEAAEAPAHAQVYLDRARQAAAATAREQALVALLGAWTRDDVPEALSLCDRILAEHPRDLLTAAFANYHQFNRGDFPAMLRTSLHVLSQSGDQADAHAMAAFAYEQCHLLADAEAAARRSLELNPTQPWAQHALAHVMLTQGRIDEGATFLETRASGWTGLNSFMLTHLWWHLVLFRLSQGREAEALQAYDEQVWGVARGYSQDQIGAVSLLARLELAGMDVGGRWDELAEWLVARADDAVQPFLSLQYLYGLARAGRPEADRLLAAIAAAAETSPEHVPEAWREVALPAAEGLAAHARADHETAVKRLGQALPRLIELGGSHAQRDLFEQILLDAVIRTRRLVQAQQMLELRLAHDPQGVPLNRMLAEVYRGLGLPAQAAAAEARVQVRLAR
jgi:hypothetical protein